ncbi:Gfo/Idh/MocA family oxidoreductase [Dyadobacter sp. CY345]|uniref:Gfo/Idh/MocA family protein n=1 Tax=Dyadobacter sp. CY345 TaxID=2909335 RepID=UPI001F3C184A|nr:Gfo/Idh/MocA family oxidoreductase [Dyadobacter sp. CY345]MCF2446193.1 Gfo/Idh/MocA family oxidoreductase [Dyadobacter sp. CY345]
MIKRTDPILVMGAGSIGERHISILQKLGFSNIWVYRQRQLPFRIIESNTVSIFTEINKTQLIKPAAAIICTPTSQHLEQALFCSKLGIAVLIEKPLSNSLAGFDELKQAVKHHKTYIQVAYMLRYHPYLQKIKATIDVGELGKLLSMQSCWSEYLPDWHPWEDYRISYAARKDFGGGAALTLSHDIDVLNWLANSPVDTWQTIKNYQQMPELDVESSADILINYKNKITAQCHLDFHNRIPRRWYRFDFEKGFMELNYYKSELITFSDGKTITQSLSDFDRNQLYEAQTLDFFHQIQKGEYLEKALKSIEESELIISICQS